MAAPEELRSFSEIKNKIEDICDKYIQKHLSGKRYDSRNAQSWANQATEEIIKQSQEEVSVEYKYCCTLIIL